MGRLDDIQTALKRFKKIGKIEINLYNYFWTSWITWTNWLNPARPDPTQLDTTETLFDVLFLKKYMR